METYRGMDRAQLDAAYNNRNAVKNFQEISASRLRRSETVRQSRFFHSDIRYGAGPRERIDFFPAKNRNAPVFAFLHGGYWQSGNKEASSYLVEGPLERGISVALVEYSLAPQVGMDKIVAQIEHAIDWLAAHVKELNGDPSRIVLGGHSAGGHLTAMMWAKPPVCAGLAVSGLYDLEPIRLSYLNDKLNLDLECARLNSPALNPPATCPPLAVAVGDAELPELVRQSRDYAATLAERHLPVDFVPLPGHDHFSVLEEIANPRGVLAVLLTRLTGMKS